MGMGIAAKRWARKLYSRPLSSVVDYFINSIRENKNSPMGKNAGGFLKQKVELEMEENEKALLEGNDFEPISYEWVFMIFKAKYREQEGVPIVRIMCQLSAIGTAIYRELEPGVRNPEGVWGWLRGGG